MALWQLPATRLLLGWAIWAPAPDRECKVRNIRKRKSLKLKLDALDLCSVNFQHKIVHVCSSLDVVETAQAASHFLNTQKANMA
eukprot:6418080-Amphidinium_carterae.1